MIYGLIQLVNIESRRLIEVDYLNTPAEIYTDAAKVEINGSRGLDIVARRHGLAVESLPSWVPD
jgi:hypothetical protein